jgi:hypothetical protein
MLLLGMTYLYKKEILRTVARTVVPGLCAALFFAPSFVAAATLALDPSEGEYGPGDMFIVTIRLDTPVSECVNAASVELFYPTDWMKPTAISKGESLLTLWVEEPKIDTAKGLISFSGGIPAGYCGRVQGDPGESNVLAKVVFTIPGNMIGGKVATGPVPLALSFGPKTSVLMNDGMGTPAPLSLKTATLTRLLTSKGLTNEWLDIVHADNLPPDSFSVSVLRDPNMFEGKYFLAFTTVDKQSGVHHFEVREDDPDRLEFVRGGKERAEFVISPSPYYYELADQELRSRITVRAVDNARNHTDQIVAPLRGEYSRNDTAQTTQTTRSAWWLWLLGVIAVLFAGLAAFLVRRRHARASDSIPYQEQDNHAQ